MIDEYGMDSSDPNNIPDYIDEVALMADLARDVLVNQMNFLPEEEDEDGIYDIYVKNRSPYNYGINLADITIVDDTAVYPNASYIIIDNNYEEGSFYTSGINTMRLTLAHEFFHAIQRSYNSPSQDQTYFWEMTATFMEDIIVPDGNDYIFWVDNFFQNPNMNISSTDGYSIALFGHYLKDMVADGNINIIREIWENYSTSNNTFASIEYVLENNYETNFQYAWSDFVSRNFFNGVYDDMNNDIYFYGDQKDVIPLSLNLSSLELLNNNISINDLFINNKSANNKGYFVDNMHAITFENLNSNSVEGFISILSSQDVNYNQQFYIYNMPSEIYLNEEDILVTTLSLYNTGYLDFDINLSNPVFYLGDSNLDEVVNISDIIVLIDYIMLSSYDNQIQFSNSDLNVDDELNIYDIVLLVEMILD